MTSKEIIRRAEAYIKRLACDNGVSREAWSRALNVVIAVEDSANARGRAEQERGLRREERAEIERIKRKYGA